VPGEYGHSGSKNRGIEEKLIAIFMKTVLMILIKYYPFFGDHVAK
jgi:hypothetical protein